MRQKLLLPAIAALMGALLLAGCARKKQPATAADLAPAPPPAAAAPEPAAAPAPAPDPDPLAGDLASVMEHLRRQGLLADVHFDYDRAELSPAAREQLARDARFLKDYPQFLLTIEGHCDERGTEEYNLALGERRASTVKGYLESLGVTPGRLSTLSYGEERPLCEETEEGCWSQNRRAHPLVSGRTDG